SAMTLDGPELRRGISKDLDFSFEGRGENLRRATEIAKIINQSGLICLISIVAPSETVRQKAASSMDADSFFVIHLDPDASTLEQRTVDKESPEITYEPPVQARMKIDTGSQSVLESTNQVFDLLKQEGFLL
ncbi:MAG: adenylyl-sulfate kinase, partial [Planctomycetota bacterium]|nr:adenylyl-sulfate kinase [Planctomycetota bacterium]